MDKHNRNTEDYMNLLKGNNINLNYGTSGTTGTCNIVHFNHTSDTIPFGRYKHQTLGNIIESNPKYIVYMIKIKAFSINKQLEKYLDESLYIHSI